MEQRGDLVEGEERRFAGRGLGMLWWLPTTALWPKRLDWETYSFIQAPPFLEGRA